MIFLRMVQLVLFVLFKIIIEDPVPVSPWSVVCCHDVSHIWADVGWPVWIVHVLIMQTGAAAIPISQ